MKKTIYLILCTALAFSFGKTNAQTIDDGRRFTRNEQFEDAEKVFNDMITKSPKNGEAYYWAGINYLESGDSLNAAQIFDKGLLNSPKYTLNYVGKGHLKLREGKTAEAEAFFVLALKAKKKLRGLVNREIARAYLMVKDRDKATLMAYANKASEYLKAATPGDFEVKLLEGDAAYFTNIVDKTDAVTKYIESGYINPESPLPLLREALVYQRVKNYDLSLVRVDEALSKDEAFAPGYRQKADLFAEMKQRDSAVFYYKEYLKRNNNLSARRRFVNALFFNQQYDDAIREAKALLQIREFTNLYGVIAYAIVEKNDTSKALNREGLEYFEKYEEKNVKPANRQLSPSEKFFKGALLHRSGDREAGWALQKQVLDDTATASARWYDMAREMNYSSRNYTRAIEVILLKYTKTKNKTSLDQFYLAMSYRLSEQYQKSNQVFEEILVKDSNYLKGYHYIALNWHILDPKDSTGNVSKAYMRWINRMTPEEKVKFKKDIEYAYLSMADMESKKAAAAFQTPEDKAAGYAKTIELYKNTIALYKTVLEYSPDDQSVKDQIQILEKFVASLEARKKKKR